MQMIRADNTYTVYTKMSPENNETVVECKCDTCFKVRHNIKQIFRVLDIYGWLLDSYIVVCFQFSFIRKIYPQFFPISLKEVMLTFDEIFLNFVLHPEIIKS